MQRIARIETDFPTKFGIPRQSGLVSQLKGRVVFEPEFRNPDAVRGLEDFSHIWLLWQFSETMRDTWSPTVRPPRLGGNTRVGVFATRSPFRPNPIGLSSVCLERVELEGEKGPVLYVSGVDMVDQTPIYDIKPYLPYVDSHPEAVGGFADSGTPELLEVVFPQKMADLSGEQREALCGILAQDPRPPYQQDPERIYGMEFAGREVKFTVEEQVVTVISVEFEEDFGG